MVCPSNSIAPETGRRKPMMLRNVVVLPAPLRPTKQTSSPCPTSERHVAQNTAALDIHARSRTESINAPSLADHGLNQMRVRKESVRGRSASTCPSDSAMIRCE